MRERRGEEEVVMRVRVGAAHVTDSLSTTDSAIKSDAVRCGACVPFDQRQRWRARVSAGAGP